MNFKSKLSIMTMGVFLVLLGYWLFPPEQDSTPAKKAAPFVPVEEQDSKLEGRSASSLNSLQSEERVDQKTSARRLDQNKALSLRKKKEGSESGPALFAWLHNKDNSLNERINRVTELGRQKILPRSQLIQLVVSENPYKETKRGPHTYNQHLFQQEAALRVHGMKVLASSRESASDRKGSFLRIVQDAKDENIRVIAQQVLNYEERGRSFFKDVPQGLKGLKPPQD